MLAVLELLLVCFIAGIALYLVKKQKQQEAYIVTEEEAELIQSNSNATVERDYFNLRMDLYLKTLFPNMISWEYENNPRSLKQMNLSNMVFLTFRNGTTAYKTVYTSNVWSGIGAEKKAKEEKEEEIKKPDEISLWIEQHGSKIASIIHEQMNSGVGFFASYEVDQTLATDDFMKKLVQALSDNTEYDVSHEGNKLLLGFQHLLDC